MLFLFYFVIVNILNAYIEFRLKNSVVVIEAEKFLSESCVYAEIKNA